MAESLRAEPVDCQGIKAMKRIGLTAVAIASVSFAGCESQDCQLVDCDSALIVNFGEPLLIDEGVLRVQVGDTEVTHRIEPDYQQYAPNGYDCGPICFLGNVQAELPR
jgi:hypothetical protein